MANEKKELSKEEQEAIKKVEEAVESLNNQEEKREIKNLADEVVDSFEEKKEAIKAEIKDTAEELEQKAQELKEDVTDLAKETKEGIEDSAKSVVEGAKEEIDDTAKEIDNLIESPKKESKTNIEDIKPKGAKNKNLIAKTKIEEVKKSIQEVEKEVEEVVQEVKAKINDFEEYEANVLNRVIAQAKDRLKNIGFEEDDRELPVPKAEIETKDKPMSINDISTGAGGAFVTGVLGSIATLIGWCIYASKVEGSPFPPHKLPDLAELSSKASVISKSLGLGENPQIGAGIAIGSALLVFILIYKLMVSMKASKNLEISKKIEENAKEYSKKKLEFKEMVKKIGEHVDELRDTTEKFEVLMEEKSASLRRANKFEDAQNFEELNPKTKEIASDANNMVKGLEELLSAPMAKDAVLNEESIEALNRAKELVNNQVEKIYK